MADTFAPFAPPFVTRTLCPICPQLATRPNPSLRFIKLTAQGQHIPVERGLHFIGQLVKQFDHAAIAGRCEGNQSGKMIFPGGRSQLSDQDLAHPLFLIIFADGKCNFGNVGGRIDQIFSNSHHPAETKFADNRHNGQIIHIIYLRNPFNLFF